LVAHGSFSTSKEAPPGGPVSRHDIGWVVIVMAITASVFLIVLVIVWSIALPKDWRRPADDSSETGPLILDDSTSGTGDSAELMLIIGDEDGDSDVGWRHG
jgi:hypothetical protein